MLAAAPTEEQRQFIIDADDPAAWAEHYFMDPDEGKSPFVTKPMFLNLIRDPRPNRAARVGRQSGKTVHLCVDLLHTATFWSNSVILVFVPEKKQMNRMLEIMEHLFHDSVIKDSYLFNQKKSSAGKIEADYDYEIKVSNGSVIRFFFMQNNPNKARGIRGTHIYIDEAEYIQPKAYDVIGGIPKSNPGIKVWASSTPSGLEDTWFRIFCDKCSDPKNEAGAEYHLPSTMEENWPEIEQRLRNVIFDEISWKLEVLAEWADPKGAVYKKDLIDQAIERSLIGGRYPTIDEIRQLLSYKQGIKVLGVDWNQPQNGVRLVEVTDIAGIPWVTRNDIIKHEQYTQKYAVEQIIKLYIENDYKAITVDKGYGETQIDMIFEQLAKLGKEPSEIVNIIDSGSKEETIIDYVSPSRGRRRQRIVTRFKSKIVGLLAKYIERELALPKEEDDRGRLIHEIRNFKRKASNTEGGFIYTENSHSLSALQLCIHGYEKYRLRGAQPQSRAAQNIAASDDFMKNIKKSHRQPSRSPQIAGSMWGKPGMAHSRTAGLHGNPRRTTLPSRYSSSRERD